MRLATAAVVAGLLASPLSLAADSLSAALQESTPSLDLRLRGEWVDQDNTRENAYASTLRTRFGIKTGSWLGAHGYVEYEGVSSLGHEHYHSGPGGNGLSQFSVIADPQGSELNQAYVDINGPAGLSLRAGRQRIVFDNARFVGNVGWRQNEQTYDAIRLNAAGPGALKLSTVWLRNVNNIFFGNLPSDSWLANASYAYADRHTAAAYGYFLDPDGSADSRSVGLRFSGKFALSAVGLSYHAEYAQQRPWADAAPASSQDYARLELGVNHGAWGAKLGHELLGGDGQNAFQTPLATLHAFNGWTDTFLSTPAGGLTDTSIGASLKHGKWKLVAKGHKFAADTGAQDYGSEIDLLLAYGYSKKTKLAAKFGDYNADGFGVDTQKFWLQLSHAI